MEKLERLGIEYKRGRKVTEFHTAEEKCRAVLSVWTERRTPGEVCRELGIVWNLFNQWQQKAMEGMLLALEPRFPLVPVDKGMALNPRLAVVLAKKSKAGGIKSLEQRLTKLQGKIPRSKSGGSQETGVEKKP